MFKSLKCKLDQWKRTERKERQKIYKINARKIDYLVNDNGTSG